jgi:hypothetical protein
MNQEMRAQKANRLKYDLISVKSEIVAIKQKRNMIGAKEWRFFSPKYQTRRLSHLVGIRSSLQAKIARL